MMTYTADQAKRDLPQQQAKRTSTEEKAEKYVETYIVRDIKLLAAFGNRKLVLPQTQDSLYSLSTDTADKYWWPDADDAWAFQNEVCQILEDAGYEVREDAGSLVVTW